MDWTKCLVLIGQMVCVAVLGSLVALGHDSTITDGLLAITGSVAGVGVYQAITGKAKN